MPEGGKNALLWTPKEEKPWAKIAGAIAVVVVVGGGIAFALSGDETAPAPSPDKNAAQPQPAAQPSPPATPQPPAPEPAQPKAVQPKAAQPKAAQPAPAEPKPASAPADPEPPKPAAAPPKPAAQPAGNVDQCVAKHFAPDAFTGKLPKFGFVCTQTDPRRTAMNLKARLVYAQQTSGSPVTDAMKEWSILNWYELAFASIVAHACCATPPTLDAKNNTCKFNDKIIALGKAGATGEGLDEALAAYDKGVMCLINFGLAAHYKQKHPTYGPERTLFKKVSERSRK